MRVRLAYRAAERIHPPHRSLFEIGGVDYERTLPLLRKRLEGTSQLIKLSTNVCLDNVAAYYAASEKQFEYYREIPNWAPPFQSMFMEWNEPTTWNIRGAIEEHESDGQMGVQVISVDARKINNARELACMTSALCGFGLSGGDVFDEMSRRLMSDVPKSRWLLFMDAFAAGRETNGRCHWIGIEAFILVGEHGQFVNMLTTGLSSRYLAESGIHVFDNVWKIAGLGMSFMNCRNVEVREGDLSPGRRWHAQTKVPRLTFKTLNITPEKSGSTRKSQREGESTEGRSLHICRGHFAHYTDENPLFGKYTGTFWRPDHVRGDAAHGVVEKDYSIDAQPEAGE